MDRFFTNTWEILKASQKSFRHGEPIVFSAAIAFFTIFSLPAILIILMFAGSMFFSEQTVRQELVKEVGQLISAEAAEQVASILTNAVETPTGFWGILISIVVVTQSSAITFFIIQKALNAVWHVRIRSGAGIVKLMKNRLTAVAMVGGLGLLFALTLLFDTVIAMFSQELRAVLNEYFSPLIRTLNTAFYLTIVFVFFTSILKLLPDVWVSWKDALAGGVITSLLFLVGKQVINFVLSQMVIAGIYAAAGSLVILLLWVFYSSVILLLGAEVTKAYATNRGREVQPKDIAEKYER